MLKLSIRLQSLQLKKQQQPPLGNKSVCCAARAARYRRRNRNRGSEWVAKKELGAVVIPTHAEQQPVPAGSTMLGASSSVALCSLLGRLYQEIPPLHIPHPPNLLKAGLNLRKNKAVPRLLQTHGVPGLAPCTREGS